MELLLKWQRNYFSLFRDFFSCLFFPSFFSRFHFSCGSCVCLKCSRWTRIGHIRVNAMFFVRNRVRLSKLTHVASRRRLARPRWALIIFSFYYSLVLLRHIEHTFISSSCIKMKSNELETNKNLAKQRNVINWLICSATSLSAKYDCHHRNMRKTGNKFSLLRQQMALCVRFFNFHIFRIRSLG